MHVKNTINMSEQVDKNAKHLTSELMHDYSQFECKIGMTNPEDYNAVRLRETPKLNFNLSEILSITHP